MDATSLLKIPAYIPKLKEFLLYNCNDIVTFKNDSVSSVGFHMQSAFKLTQLT